MWIKGGGRSHLPDIVDPQTRSRMMAGIRGRDTKPEIMIRRGLHRIGFRFRLHAKKLPGKPDIVLPRYGAAVFVHGCFWHGHECHLFRLPSTRQDFWRTKITRNVTRDQEVSEMLHTAGWRRLVIWECALKGKRKLDYETVLQRIATWIRAGETDHEIAGYPFL
jgi:DNA mismatch endonuclease (patch repair protein)